VAISGFLLLRHLYGWVPLLSIIEGTILHLVTMDRVIITITLIEFGSRATGKRDGLPMVGKGPGFQVIGNIGDK
jgi:hypothetical protein